MQTLTTLYVIDSDPDPVVEFGGTKYDIPMIRFGSIVGAQADIFLMDGDLAGWCRRLAVQLNEFADKMEEEK